MDEHITLETYQARRKREDRIARDKRALSSNAERQRAFKTRMKERGLIQVNGWVHEHQRADIASLLAALAADPDLEAGPARSACSGKLVAHRRR